MSWPGRIESEEPMKLARGMHRQVWGSEGVPSVVKWSGRLWEWEGVRWTEVGHEELVGLTWRWLEDKEMNMGQGVTKRLQPSGTLVRDTLEALLMGVVQQIEGKTVPFDLKEREEGDGRTVTFEDVVVDVGEWARTGVETVRRREKGWFDPVTVPVRWEEARKAGAERYERALGEWGGQDKDWNELVERMFGYALMGTREWQKMFLLWGVARGGKGVGMEILKAMMPRQVMSVSLKRLMDSFGQDGLERARVLNVTEATNLGALGGNQAGGVLKEVATQDEIQVRAPYQRQRQVRPQALVVMQGNQMPNLTNEGDALMGKVVLVPYDHSFKGREEFGLAARITRQELGGVARRWVEAAVRLAGADAGAAWPRLERVRVVEDEFRGMMNPLDKFLEWGFERGGKTTVEAVGRKFDEWRASTVEGRGVKMSPTHLAMRLVETTTWGLRIVRPHGGVRMLVGLSLKRT